MDGTKANEDLREGRLRYFETHQFPLFSHIDLRGVTPTPYANFTMRSWGYFSRSRRRCASRYGYTGVMGAYERISSTFSKIRPRDQPPAELLSLLQAARLLTKLHESFGNTAA